MKTGKATMKSKLDKPPPTGTWVTVDFNPVADRLRIMSNDGTNLRVNVDDGKVTVDGSHKFAEADMHKGEKPNIVAGAYTNSFKGAKETALYNIDGTIGGLIKQAPPNDGTLNGVGKLGIKVDVVAFDIWSDGQGKNEAWLMAGDWLHSVDLATGKACRRCRSRVSAACATSPSSRRCRQSAVSRAQRSNASRGVALQPRIAAHRPRRQSTL